MSFNGGSLNVGTLTAQFNLDATGAASSISSIINQTNSLKQVFTTTNILKIDSTSAVSNINKATDSVNLFKRALEFGGALLAIDAIAKGFDGLKNATIGTNAAIEQAQLKFTALSGSAQVAQTLMGQLETLAAHSTFGLTQITAAAGGLEAFGVNVTNIPPLIQAMQNAAAAAGGDMSANFSNLARILGELAGGLPLTERQVRQLVTAGIPLQPLANQLGITVDQLLNVGKTGIVTGDQLVAAFAKVYTSGNLGDFMQKQAGTFNGAMALIKTNVSLAAATAFRPLFDVVSSLVVKLGQFVQTATFNQWVSQISAGLTAVVGLFKQLGEIIAPVGRALANFFGLDTSNIGQQMAAVSQATVDVGSYNSALQDSGAAASDTKAQLADYKAQVDAAADAILGLNGQLADNQVLLDANARAIAAVKNQYDPIIKSAEQSIRDINTPTADELSRKQRELELDRDKANLELTKPDTSSYDATILNDQTLLANWPTLDTSSWDTQISGTQAAIDKAQENDPAAAIKDQIASIQDAMNALNTSVLDDKINAIRDTLSQPAPDTSGLTNTLAALSAQIEMAGPGADTSGLRSQYAATSAQKAGILTGYEQSQTGLKGQLTTLESQRRDQATANAEQKKADQARIEDLKEQEKVVLANAKVAMDGLKDRLATEQKGKAAQVKADADARKALEEDIKREGNLRSQALAPYTAALKKITDQQAQNSLADAAAAAQRTLDLAPYQAALDKAKQSEQDALAPLLVQKQTYDDIKTSLTEARRQQDLAKQSAQDQADALKQGAASAKSMADSLGMGAGLPKTGPSPSGASTGTLPTPDASPFVLFVNTVTGKLHDLVNSDDWSVIFTGKHLDGSPVSVKGRLDLAVTDIFDGIGTIDTRLQSWIKSHDASGIWGMLIYGKNPDGSSATATQQLGAFFGAINTFITGWLSDNGPKWLTSWAQVGTDLKKAWDGPSSFNWTSVGSGLAAILGGVDGWFAANGPKWLTNWSGVGSALKSAWDGPSSFNWTGIGSWFGGVGSGIDTWLTEHAPGWLTSWTTLGSDLAGAFNGTRGFNWTSVGAFFTGIANGIDGFATEHFPGWLQSWQGFAQGLGSAFNGLGGMLSGALSGAGDIIQGFLGGIAGAAHAIGNLFGVDQLKNFTMPGANTGGGNGFFGPPVPQGLAVGTDDWAGGPAIVGEAGRELVNRTGKPMQQGGAWELTNGPTLIPDLPKGAAVLPNHVTESLLSAGVPGFAGGLGGFFGDVVGGVKDFVGSVGGAAINGILGMIPDVSLPGAFAGVGPALVKDAKDGIGSLFSSLLGKQHAPTHTGNNGGGFQAMLLDAYLAYLNTFGGPLDNESAFNDLMGVGQQKNVDPRWLMAIMQTEDGFGTAANDQLPQYNNYGGMGVRSGGLGFPSPISATDGGPQPYAAFNSFHDFLEDEADWIRENGTSFSGYQTADAGQGKNAAFQQILAAIPDLAGPTKVSGGGGDSNIVNAAAGYLGQANTNLTPSGFWAWYCETLVDHAINDAGYGYLGYPSADDHANAQSLFGGIGPPGSSMFWDFAPNGHVAISVGDGSVISTITPNGAPVAQVDAFGTFGQDAYMGWAPPGLADGGYFKANDPRLAMIGEGSHDEIVAPLPMLRDVVSRASGGGGATVNVTFAPGSIVAAPGMSTPDLADEIVQRQNDRVLRELLVRGHRVG